MSGYIYVASSWRNPTQPLVVDALRVNGFDCYDFRNPECGTGFAWREVMPGYDGSLTFGEGDPHGDPARGPGRARVDVPDGRPTLPRRSTTSSGTCEEARRD